MKKLLYIINTVLFFFIIGYVNAQTPTIAADSSVKVKNSFKKFLLKKFKIRNLRLSTGDTIKLLEKQLISNDSIDGKYIRVNLIDTNDFHTFCKTKLISYFSDSTAKNMLLLKEYFYFNIGMEGNVGELKDERTEINGNTTFLNSTDFDILKKLKFSPEKTENMVEETLIPLGISMTVERTYHKTKIKVKKNKIRIYQTPGYVEYIRKKDSLYISIMNEYNNLFSDSINKKTKKFELTLLQGNISLYEMEGKEFNPFYQKVRDLYNKKILFITEFIPTTKPQQKKDSL